MREENGQPRTIEGEEGEEHSEKKRADAGARKNQLEFSATALLVLLLLLQLPLDATPALRTSRYCHWKQLKQGEEKKEAEQKPHSTPRQPLKGTRPWLHRSLRRWKKFVGGLQEPQPCQPAQLSLVLAVRSE